MEVAMKERVLGKWLLAVLSVVLGGALIVTVAGCGGGGGSGQGQDAASLPPDPGEAGKQTLEGIDSDNDGVRDDLQRYIILTYSDTPTRQALAQYAKAQQSMILSSGSAEQSLNSANEIVRSVECIAFTRPDDFSQVIDAARAELLNTEARIRAFVAANTHVSGMVFTMTDSEELANSCK